MSDRIGGSVTVASWRDRFRGLDRDQPPRCLSAFATPLGSNPEAYAMAVEPRAYWRRFLNDCAKFLSETPERACWAECAHVLGWHETELFGIDRERPALRFDRMGVLWVAAGSPITAVGEDAIAYRDGRNYRRSQDLDPACLILPWQMK